MSLDTREPSLIWDALNIDLVYKVAQMSVLNPLFSMWCPILVIQQQYSVESSVYLTSLTYFVVTFVLAALRLSSHVWTNRAWRAPSWITSFFGGPALNWDDQIVVVTGGAGGIGRMLVETLGVMGVTVVVIDRREYVADWDDVYSYVCDLADPKAIAAVAEKIREDVGHPTIIINNAGVVQGKLLVDLTAEDVKQTFDVNVLAQFAMIREFLPAMIKAGKGHIVTVSSVFGLAGAAQLSDYCASKHALMGLHESLKYELKYRYGDSAIRTTVLIPGQVRTPLFASIRPSSRLVSFLAPISDPHTIAKAVIAALDTNQSREIYIPLFGHALWAVRGLPSWGQDFLAWFSGANEAMETFVKAGEDGKKEL